MLEYLTGQNNQDQSKHGYFRPIKMCDLWRSYSEYFQMFTYKHALMKLLFCIAFYLVLFCNKTWRFIKTSSFSGLVRTWTPWLVLSGSAALYGSPDDLLPPANIPANFGSQIVQRMKMQQQQNGGYNNKNGGYNNKNSGQAKKLPCHSYTQCHEILNTYSNLDSGATFC